MTYSPRMAGQGVEFTKELSSQYRLGQVTEGDITADKPWRTHSPPGEDRTTG